jgi:hypothetical protein
MENAGIFYAHLEHFTVIWCILWPFGNVMVIWYISLVLVYCVEKNLATLVWRDCWIGCTAAQLLRPQNDAADIFAISKNPGAKRTFLQRQKDKLNSPTILKCP